MSKELLFKSGIELKKLIKNKSSLFDINKHVKHDGYERSIERDKIFLENMKVELGVNIWPTQLI